MPNISKMISEVEKGFPITRYPKTIPKIQNKIVSWKTDGNETIGISLGDQGQHAHGDSLIFIQDALLEFQFFNNHGSKVLIPKNALTVSWSLKNFKVGRSAQEFIPIDQEIPADAFFSYQMLSKHCQATYYNEGSVQFLAGICYYLQLRSSFTVTSELDKHVMNEAYLGHQAYPLASRWESLIFKTYKTYGRYCKMVGRQVVVKNSEHLGPVHQYFNYRTRDFEFKSCGECVADARNYEFEETKSSAQEAIDQSLEAPKLEEKKAENQKEEEKDFDYVSTGDEEEEEDFDFAIDLNKN